MSGKNGLDLIKLLLSVTKQTNNFSRHVLNKVEFVSATDGHCVAEMDVGIEHTNEGGTLHGGCSATLLDCVSSLALITKSDGQNTNFNTGVSVDIHMSYLKAAKIGDRIVIDARTTKMGKTLAFLDVEIRNKKCNSIIAKGSHTKFIGTY